MECSSCGDLCTCYKCRLRRQEQTIGELRARVAELEKQNKTAIDTAIELLMNYCEAHREPAGFDEFIQLTAGLACRACLVAERDAATARAEQAEGMIGSYENELAAIRRELEAATDPNNTCLCSIWWAGDIYTTVEGLGPPVFADGSPQEPGAVRVATVAARDAATAHDGYMAFRVSRSVGVGPSREEDDSA